MWLATKIIHINQNKVLKSLSFLLLNTTICPSCINIFSIVKSEVSVCTSKARGSQTALSATPLSLLSLAPQAPIDTCGPIPLIVLLQQVHQFALVVIVEYP